MKITAVKPWLISTPWPYPDPAGVPVDGEYVFVEVQTDEGITGWGEITVSTPWANRAAFAILAQIGGLIEGDDPAHIEAIWHKVFRTFSYMGTRGAVANMVSAIDIALWDIRGKQLGLPIYDLMGGPVRDSLALYTHPKLAHDPQSVATSCKQIVASGYTTVKWDPFPQHPEETNGYLSGRLDASETERGINVLAAIREAVGPAIEILIDGHGRFNVATAIRLAGLMAPYNIGWFEEPVPVESYHALRQVRQNTGVPICVGERLHTRYEFVPIFEGELADYIMPDVTWAGGISELKKISTMAEAYYVPICPHDASGPVNVVASAHVMMTVPNFYKLENCDGTYDELIDPPLDIRDGHLHLSDRPGLGFEMNLEYLRQKAISPFSG